MAKANKAISLGIASLIVIALIIIVGFGVYLNSTIGSQSTTTSSIMAKLPPYYADNVSYSTSYPQVPSNARVNEAFNGYADFLQLNQVKINTVSLVDGTVLGFVNSTAQNSGFLQVISSYIFKVNTSLIGNIPTGQKVLVSQEAGLTQLSNETYVNGTLNGYPPLSIGGEYVLALFMPTNQTLRVLGPNAVFPVRNDLIYPPEPNTPFSTAGTTLSQFFQTWNNSFNYATATTASNYTVSGSSCVSTETTETISGLQSTNNGNSTVYTTWTTTAQVCT